MEATINILPGAAAAPQQAMPAGTQASGGNGTNQGSAFAGMLQNATVKDAEPGQKTTVPSGLAQLAFLAQLPAMSVDGSKGDGSETASATQDTAGTADIADDAKDQASAALMGLILPMIPVQPTVTTAGTAAGEAATSGENEVTAAAAKQAPVAVMVPTTDATQNTAATDKDKSAVTATADKDKSAATVVAAQPQSFTEVLQQKLTKPEQTDAQTATLPAADEQAAVTADTAKTQTTPVSVDFPVQTVHAMSNNKSVAKEAEQLQPVSHSQSQETAVQPVTNSVQDETRQGMNQGQPEEQTAFSDGTKHQTEDVPDLTVKNDTVTAAFTQFSDSQTIKAATPTQTAAHTQQPVADPYNLSGQIVEQAKLIKTPYSDASEMVIKLKPEHLGELTLRVAVEHGEVTASFHTNNPEVRGIIENSLPQLKQDMASQGIKVDNVGVYAGLSQFDSRGQQANQQQPVIKLKNRKNDDDFITTVESLQAEQTGSDTGVDYRV